MQRTQTSAGLSNEDSIVSRSLEQSRGTGMALGLLTAVNAVLYIGTSILHTGLRLPLGFATLGFPAPSPPAAIAEGIIGIVLAVASVALFAHGRRTLGWTWPAYVFALAGTLLGFLTILLMLRVRGPDLWIHFVM